MNRVLIRSLVLRGVALSLVVWGVCGCMPHGLRARLMRENQTLREENEKLNRTVAQRDATVASLHRQIDALQSFDEDRPADLFAPTHIEIASLSGGADYDDKPGDDGVTIHLRLRDQDGDAVKVPGLIKVQLLDNADLSSPRVLGVYVFDDVEKLRRMWHQRFGTEHYTLKCPFSPGVVPTERTIQVKVEFTDFLTGRTLTAVKEVEVHLQD